MSKSFFSSVAGASLLIVIVSAAGKGIGFLREIILAGSFGLSKEYDLYLLGTAVPFMLNVAIYYLAQNFFLPLFNRERHKPDFHEASFLYRNMILFMIFGAVIGALLHLSSCFLPSLVGDTYNGTSTSIASDVLQILALTVPIFAIISIITAYLQAKYDFKLAIISQVIPNILLIVSVIFFGDVLNVMAIPLGYFAGSIIQLGLLLLKIKGKIKVQKGVFRNIFTSSGTALGLLLLIELSGQVYVIADRYFLSKIASGGIAALSYATTVITLPVSVIALAFGTAIFPKLSELASDERWKELSIVYFRALDICFFIFIPITALFFFYGEIIIQVLYQRGQFDAEATALTSVALRDYSIGMIFLAGFGILHKLMLGADHIKALSIIMFTMVAIKIIGNTALVPFYGYRGMALSTTVSNIALFVVSFIYILNKHSLKITHSFLFQLLTSVINMFGCIIVSRIILSLAGNNTVALISILILFCLQYLVTGFIMRQSALESLKSMVRGLRAMR